MLYADKEFRCYLKPKVIYRTNLTYTLEQGKSFNEFKETLFKAYTQWKQIGPQCLSRWMD